MACCLQTSQALRLGSRGFPAPETWVGLGSSPYKGTSLGPMMVPGCRPAPSMSRGHSRRPALAGGLSNALRVQGLGPRV